VQMLSIQCLSISLSVTLVLVTGGIIGGLSITFGNQATDRTKSTCQRGLEATRAASRNGFAQLDQAANDGVNQSLSSGRENAEILTQLVMTQALGTIRSQVVTFFDIAGYTGEVVKKAFYGIDHWDWGDPGLWHRTIRPMTKSLYEEGNRRGMTVISLTYSQPDVDGVPMGEGMIVSVAPQVRQTETYSAHNNIGAIKFYCDNLNQQQCAAAKCIWCSKPNGQGYCGNPMRQEGGVPMPCKTSEGWNLPVNYQEQWYQTTLFKFGLGVSDTHGNMYLGSCGWDPDCGCKALDDWRLKKGDDLAHGAPVGRYKRLDGSYPEPGDVPKSQLHEAGVCKMSEDFSGLSLQRAARLKGKYPDGVQHWTPMYGFDVSPLLATMTWFTIRNGDQTVDLFTGVNLERLSGFMADATQDLPKDSRMYIIQTDSWKKHGVCEDDFHRMLPELTMTCPVINGIIPLMVPDTPPCEVDLRVLSTLITRFNFVKEHCPVMCGVCEQGGSFPVEEYDGWLVGASHGKHYKEIPVDQSAFYEFTGLVDIIGKRAMESSDYVVANHSSMVMTQLGGFANLNKDTQWIDRDGRLWWVKREPIKIGDYEETSLDLTLILLVLRDAAMEVIDKATKETGEAIAASQEAARVWFTQREAETAEQIRKDDEETEKQKEEGFYIMIGVTVFSVSVLLAGSVVFVRLIIAPLLVLEREMAEVAVMHLEEVDRERPPSKLAEVADMQASFMQMIVNLIEYRNYMPASVLLDDDDEEEEEESVVETAKEETDASPRQSKATAGSSLQSPRGSRASKASPRGSRASSMSRSVRSKQSSVCMSPRGGGAGRAFEKQSLAKKQVSFAVITLRGWHTEATKADLSGAHGDIISSVLSVFVAQKGVPDVFSGDRILCSYNGIKATRLHKTNAALSALQGSDKAREAATAAGVLGMSTSAACVSGEVFCGNSGCTGMKRFSFFGAPVTWVWGLERVNAVLQTRILADSLISSEVNTKVQVRPIEKVKFPKRFPKDSHAISELMNEMEAAEDEWMYQLEEGEKNNKYGPWTTLVQSVMQGKFEADFTELRSAIAAMEKEGAAAVPPPLWERFNKAISEGQYAPLELLFH